MTRSISGRTPGPLAAATDAAIELSPGAREIEAKIDLSQAGVLETTGRVEHDDVGVLAAAVALGRRREAAL